MGGCNKSGQSRGRDEIFRELQSLPALFLTATSKKRVTAPGHKGNFVDKDTQEICWRAMQCINPKCPSGGTDKKPVVFIVPDLAMFAKPDGTFGYDIAKAEQSINRLAGNACPECLKSRNLEKESQAEKDLYARWVEPYVLPDSAKRQKKLEAELEKSTEQVKGGK